jgi:hypothetical protein
MSNILSAYEEINDDKQEMKNEDESFLILLTYLLPNSAKNISDSSTKSMILTNS